MSVLTNMEKIIQKSIEGGFIYLLSFTSYSAQRLITLDPLFWKALGKACEWQNIRCTPLSDDIYTDLGWIEMKATKFYALRFYEINLTEGWEKAISYLQEVTK